MEFLLEYMLFFLLIFFRISGIFFVAPFFADRAIIKRMRFGFTLFTSFIIYSAVPKDFEALKNVEFLEFIQLGIKELLIGLIIGFLLLIIFSSVQTAAQVYSMSMGFGMVNVLDPLTQFQVPVMGMLKYLVLLAIFLVFGIHRRVLLIVIDSFYKYKVAHINYDVKVIAYSMLDNFKYFFIVSLKIAVPILGMLFLIDVVLGVMARIAPQMNVFFLGMPLKLGVGFLILIAIMPFYMVFFREMLVNGISEIVKMIGGGVNG